MFVSVSGTSERNSERICWPYLPMSNVPTLDIANSASLFMRMLDEFEKEEDRAGRRDQRARARKRRHGMKVLVVYCSWSSYIYARR